MFDHKPFMSSLFIGRRPRVLIRPWYILGIWYSTLSTQTRMFSNKRQCSSSSTRALSQEGASGGDQAADSSRRFPAVTSARFPRQAYAAGRRNSSETPSSAPGTGGSARRIGRLWPTGFRIRCCACCGWPGWRRGSGAEAGLPVRRAVARRHRFGGPTGRLHPG